MLYLEKERYFTFFDITVNGDQPNYFHTQIH